MIEVFMKTKMDDLVQEFPSENVWGEQSWPSTITVFMRNGGGLKEDKRRNRGGIKEDWRRNTGGTEED